MVDKPGLDQLPAMAVCHRKAFPHALSTTMGQAYVEKMLEWYLVDPRAFIFFLEQSGRCVGYCGGLLVDGQVAVGSASSMLQHSYSAAVRAMLKQPWLFLHVEFLKKYRLALKNSWRKLRKLLGAPVSSTAPRVPVQPHTGLIVIGVDPQFQGKGYGSILLHEFERQSMLRGYHLMMLTVRTDNVQAIRSYERNGWKAVLSQNNSTSMEKRLKVLN